MLIWGELFQRARDEELQMIPLLAAQHLVCSADRESPTRTESANWSFFNDPHVRELLDVPEPYLRTDVGARRDGANK